MMDMLISPRRRQLVLATGALGTLGALAAIGERRGEELPQAAYAAVGGPTMGSTWTLRFAAADQDPGVVRAAVQATLDTVDARLSMFRVDSELARLNRAGAGPVAVPADLFAVLAAAADVSEWSGGAFDVTVAPLVEAWGFGTRSVRQRPGRAEIDVRRSTVDWRGLALDPARLQVDKREAGLQADLGGIAKGYGVDRAAALLDSRGIVHYMLEAGGEVRTRGVNAEGQPWRIGIEEPDAVPQQTRWIVPMSGRAMATSGDYRNYYVEDGVRYSHEIDAGSGAPIRHGLCSVTVVADDCMRADALATALIVLGPRRGPVLAEASGIAAHFIERRGAALVDRPTSAFAALGALRA